MGVSTEEKTIRLTEQEIIVGCITGLMRHADSVVNKRKSRFPEKYAGQLLLNHQMSSCAEMAFCKLMGVYFSHTKNTFHVADVGDNIEVRFSNTGKLKVRPDDNDMICVSMSGNLDGFIYNGWISSEEAKKKEWEKDYGNYGAPAYFVPNHNLNKSMFIL